MRLIKREYDDEGALSEVAVKVGLDEAVFVALVLSGLTTPEEAAVMPGGEEVARKLYDGILDLLDATYDGGLEEARKVVEARRER